MGRDYLIDLRKQRNESQQNMADVLGISRQYYSLIEDGSRQKKMDIALASRLSAHFGVPISQIIFYENDMWPSENDGITQKKENENAGI